MITQEQANAIAEREYPINYVTDTDNIILCEKLKRKAYAKALMDMNPLIEAAQEGDPPMSEKDYWIDKK